MRGCMQYLRRFIQVKIYTQIISVYVDKKIMQWWCVRTGALYIHPRHTTINKWAISVLRINKSNVSSYESDVTKIVYAYVYISVYICASICVHACIDEEYESGTKLHKKVKKSYLRLEMWVGGGRRRKASPMSVSFELLVPPGGIEQLRFLW